MSEELYKQQIIDRFQSPKHSGKIANPDFESKAVNSLCGDAITFSINVNNGIITEAKWSGEGCAISVAAADMLAEKIQKLSIDQAISITNQDMHALLGVSLKPSREKCATLALESVHAGLKGKV